MEERRQHVLSKVAFEPLNCSEMFLTGRTSGLNDFMFVAHERGQVVLLDFSLESVA